MVASTLGFARDDAIVEEPRTVDLAALVESLVDDLSDAGKPVRFEPAGRVAVACRPAALKRAVGNLIENALKYGGCARVSITADSHAVLIAVEDDGPGIPPDELETVFQPFYRVDRSRGGGPGGVGLGLSIVRAVADAHGGEVWLVNRAEGGLRAVIEFPR